MDVRTICLGILTRGDATGYEIKKTVEEDGHRHFAEASFGSIYPALNRLTEEGLVSVRAEAQEKRPDRKVHTITRAGRRAFVASLMEPLPEDRHRSPFVFAMLFADLLPKDHVSRMLGAYIAHTEEKLSRLQQADAKPRREGERFADGLVTAAYAAVLDYLRIQRAKIETTAAQAAE
ncbi:MAG: PadR family transcriptional regulator [Alphaproteobacteria bacterium]|nr:PadR family transcriptional regulator [Alphaproteobacteria bacterium]